MTTYRFTPDSGQPLDIRDTSAVDACEWYVRMHYFTGPTRTVVTRENRVVAVVETDAAGCPSVYLEDIDADAEIEWLALEVA